MDPRHCARRMACYVIAMTAALCAPVAMQAVLILRPDMIAAQHEATAMACVLAASIVAFSALVQALIDGGR